MKHTALISALAVLALAACDNKPADKPFVAPPAATHTPVFPAAALPPGHPATEVEKLETGTIVSTIDVPDFTYIEIKQGHDIRWLASKTTTAKKGQLIEFDSGSTLENFKSKALDRTFPSLTFVNTVTVVKGK